MSPEAKTVVCPLGLNNLSNPKSLPWTLWLFVRVWVCCWCTCIIHQLALRYSSIWITSNIDIHMSGNPYLDKALMWVTSHMTLPHTLTFTVSGACLQNYRWSYWRCCSPQEISCFKVDKPVFPPPRELYHPAPPRTLCHTTITRLHSNWPLRIHCYWASWKKRWSTRSGSNRRSATHYIECYDANGDGCLLLD